MLDCINSSKLNNRSPKLKFLLYYPKYVTMERASGEI